MSNCINILALHGCHQTVPLFKNMIKYFVDKLVESNMNIYFLEAKYDHPGQKKFPNWKNKTWYAKPLDIDEIGKIPYSPNLVNDVMDDIESAITKFNINILVGYSQGANVVDTYLGYRNDDRIKCAILFSGYSLVDQMRGLADCPILVVHSENDKIVLFRYKPSKYNNIEIYFHNDEHNFPSKVHIDNIILWLKNNIIL